MSFGRDYFSSFDFSGCVPNMLIWKLSDAMFLIKSIFNDRFYRHDLFKLCGVIFYSVHIKQFCILHWYAEFVLYMVACHPGDNTCRLM